MKKIILLLALVIILIFPIKTHATANWGWVDSDDYRTLWIDNNSIGLDNNGFFAYFKETFSDSGVNREVEMRRSRGKSVNGFYNLSNYVAFVYFKNSGRIKYLSVMGIAYYDKNGNVLDSDSWNNFTWSRIIPDTYGETMYDAAYSRIWRR